jgi:uncharacterized protein YegL
MSETDPEDPPTDARVRVLFLIDASASMAEGHRLEAIDRFFADMRSALSAPAQADLGQRIDIQAIRFADGAEWHVRQPTPITALDWPPLPVGGGTSTAAALTLAATVFDDPSAADVLLIVVLITDGLPTDDFTKGLADFNAAASNREIVRVAMAIDGCCDVKSLAQFVGGPEPIYVVDSSEVGLTDALNLLFKEQIFLREALAASDQECWACYDMASDATDEYSPETADFFACAADDVEDDEAGSMALGCPADDKEADDAKASPNPAGHLDDVQFTIYRPKTVRPRGWKPLLAFVHLAERRPDAADTEPDPIEQVQRQAQTLLGDNAAEYRNITTDARQGIPKESEITLVPDVPGVSFNPRSRTFRWEKDVHREEFDLRADGSLDGKVARGAISAYLGVILIARIDVAITVNAAHRDADDAQPAEAIHATPYRKIFASYSRRDAEIVRQFEQFIETTGDRFLQDVRHLRAGEKWDDGLLRLIDQADVFQLFWSSNSMGSPHVRREWEYALGLGRPAFIRPTFWEDPFPESPADSLPPDSLRRLHFHRLASVPAQPSAAEPLVREIVETSMNPSHTPPSARLHRASGPPAPTPPPASMPSPDRHYDRLDPQNNETLTLVFVSFIVAGVCALVALATFVAWLASRLVDW